MGRREHMARYDVVCAGAAGRRRPNTVDDPNIGLVAPRVAEEVEDRTHPGEADSVEFIRWNTCISMRVFS